MSKRNNITFFNVALIILAVVFVLLAVLLISILFGDNDKKQNDSSEISSVVSEVSSEVVSSEIVSSEPVSSEPQSSTPQTSEVQTGNYPEPEDENEDWYLKLVNSEYPLGEEHNPETAVIKSQFNPSGLKFDARAVDALNSMLTDAKKAGVTITVGSAYRSVARQTTLYNNKVQYYKDKGYADDAAKTAAATVVAYPGTSEHNLGLAADFYPIDETFENTAAYNWLIKNCTKYGFILRYPKDKENITKIIYEPWHYRYVGVKAAAEMAQKDMCLEEYTEYLKTK